MVDKIIIEICSTICIKGYIILESYKCLLLKSNRCPHDGLSKFVLKKIWAVMWNFKHPETFKRPQILASIYQCL